MITGVHHVCVKCRPEELEKVQKFYGELLGLSLVRSWGEPKVEGMMYGAGTSLIEIFPNAEEDLPQGAIRHFALATDDVDSIVETVRKAGYAVTMEPGDIEIMSKPSRRGSHLSSDRWEKKSSCSAKNNRMHALRAFYCHE